ncbi:thioesterase family protein [Terrarubrum flagellatum]|uniref:acyl-CoA thioesterase n=1 Tax=Terrirubrum flagellatum TaxID=2895980 RepID=UPI003144D5F7
MSDASLQNLPKPSPHSRDQYAVFRTITTRFIDNDVYAHVNNAVYYSYFDTTVSGWLLEQGLVIPQKSPVIGLAVNSACDYFDSLAFPDILESGLSVTRIGRSSVQYGVGIFKQGASQAAAQGVFTHVYVDASGGRPVALPELLRAGLQRLVVDK